MTIIYTTIYTIAFKVNQPSPWKGDILQSILLPLKITH